MTPFHEIDRIFHPRSIALVGTTADPNNWAGQMIPQALLKFEYEGNLYFVSRKNSHMPGFEVYPSIGEIPASVDYVICSIAARFTPELMEECASKGVKVVHLFTSGFSETGEEEGLRLEEEITRIARDNDIRIIGPNCPGVYCPKSMIRSVSAAREVCSKPMAVVLHEGTLPEIVGKTLSFQQRLSSLGLPVYPTLGRAALSISRFIRHYDSTQQS